jgi:hypothetical protein
MIIKDNLQPKISKVEFAKFETLWEELRGLLTGDTALSPDERGHLLWKMSYTEQFFQQPYFPDP